MLEKQDDIRNPDGTFKKGVSGNPAGRPKGKTLKEFAREWYMSMSEEEKIAYIERVEEKKPGFAWSMAEGNPSNQTDITSDGQQIVFAVPQEIAHGHSLSNTSTEQDSNE